MEVKKPYVFISYSRKDYIDENKNVIPNNTISKIVDAFDNAKINYWIDLEGVYSGDAFAPVIGKAINNCDLFLFVSTKNSNASPWTSGEIASARNYKKKILPIKIDESPYDESVVILVANLNAIEYYSNPEMGIKRLIQDTNAYFAKIEEDAKRVKEEEARRIEAERQKAEEERRWKEQEEKSRQEQQRRIITEIKVECQKLNNEETKLELDRNTLLARTERITNEKEREEVKMLITTSSPLRKKVEDEMNNLRQDVDKLEKEAAMLTQEKEDVEKKLVDKFTQELKEKEKRIGELEKQPRVSWYNEYQKEKENAERYRDWWFEEDRLKRVVLWVSGSILFLLIGTFLFFWLHGNLKFFFPREKAAISAVVEVEMDSCFIGKTGEELRNEGWDYFYGRNGKTQDTVMAFKYMKASAELGNVWGKNGLGWFYQHGYGIEQNYKEAVKWYSEAAETGNSIAQCNLGVMYDYGWGVEQNYEEAVKWFRKSADQGHSWGQYDLGLKYQYGQGVEKDTVEAIKWYKLAAAQGNEDAKNKLKELGVSEE